MTKLAGCKAVFDPEDFRTIQEKIASMSTPHNKISLGRVTVRHGLHVSIFVHFLSGNGYFGKHIVKKFHVFTYTFSFIFAVRRYSLAYDWKLLKTRYFVEIWPMLLITPTPFLSSYVSKEGLTIGKNSGFSFFKYLYVGHCF